jgi:hypothetical protein
MNPTDFFALVRLKPAERTHLGSAQTSDSLMLTYDLGSDTWGAGVTWSEIRFEAAGRSVGEVFEILMHGLRRRGLVEDVPLIPDDGSMTSAPAAGAPPVSSEA